MLPPNMKSPLIFFGLHVWSRQAVRLRCLLRPFPGRVATAGSSRRRVGKSARFTPRAFCRPLRPRVKTIVFDDKGVPALLDAMVLWPAELFTRLPFPTNAPPVPLAITPANPLVPVPAA
jgi:hypothetical protein